VNGWDPCDALEALLVGVLAFCTAYPLAMEIVGLIRMVQG
jgi:hypothetical protein